MAELAYCAAASVRAVVGTAGTGKTQALVEGVCAALEAGTEPDGVLVLAASAPAAAEFARRLHDACGAAADGVRATTPLALAREVLAGNAGTPVLGGRTHVLADFEANFFLEDMRVTGIKQRRLKEMLKFLQRGWSEMREDEEGWLVTGEEVAVNDFARSRLACMGAFVRAEATAACVRLLTEPEGVDALAGLRRPLVVADDFAAMSRASQRLAGLLAGERLLVGWDPLGGLVGEEPYGYAEGLVELEAACPGTFERVDLEESRQAAAPYAAVANLFAQECLAEEGFAAPQADPAAPRGAFSVEVADDLADEMPLVARTVRRLLDGGAAPDEVFVAVPTDAWGRRASDALERAGVACTRVEERQALGGDIRDRAKCGPAIAYTALHLAADPASATAWRAWCGFGDYLACSTGMAKLAERRGATGAALPELLAGLDAAEDLPVDLEKLRARHAAGRALLARVEGLRGGELLAELSRAALEDEGAEVPAALAALVGEAAPDATADELHARAEQALMALRFEPGRVRVGGYDALIGQAPRALVLCGLVDGLVPPLAYFDLSMATADAQAKMHRRLVARLVGVCGKARETLVCTAFAHAGIVENETLHLKAERIRLRDGRRVCDLGTGAVVRYLRGDVTTKIL